MPRSERGGAGALPAFFRHNTWANLTLLGFCEGLSDRQLDATVVGGFGSIRETLVHVVGSEVDYVDLATGKPPPAPPPERFEGFAVLKEAVRWAGEEWLRLATAERADAIVRVERPGEPIFEYPLAGLMVQAVNHSTEHRTQIATILTQLGLEPPSLSGWKHMRERGEFHEFDARAEGAGER